MLDPSLDYPGEFHLCFEEFVFQDGIACWSVDFYLDDHLAEDWETIPREYGIFIRLLIPDGTGSYDEPFMTMRYPGCGIVWTFAKEEP